MKSAHHARPPASLRNAFGVLVGNYLGFFLTIPFAVLVARSLGPQDKGIWSIFVQFLFFAELIGSWGGAGYILKSSGSSGRVLFALSQSLALSTLMTGLIGGLLLTFLASGLLLPAAGPQSLAIAAAGMILLVLSRLAQHAAVSLSRGSAYAGALFSQSAIQLTALLIWEGVGDLTLRVALMAWLLGVAGRLIVPLLLVPELRWVRPRRFSSGALRFGAARFPVELGDSMATRVVVVIMPLWYSLNEIGVFSVALGLFEALSVVSMSAATSGLPALSIVQSQLDRQRRFSSMLSITVMASIIVSLGVGLPIALGIGLIFGKAYSDATQSLILMLPATALLAVARTSVAGLTAIGRQRVAVWTPFIAAVVTVLVLPLCRAWGSLGASLAVALGLLGSALYCVVWIRAAGFSWLPFGTSVRAFVSLFRAQLPRRGNV
jgi:O-antigen/teichoic acid export membrane protein